MSQRVTVDLAQCVCDPALKHNSTRVYSQGVLGNKIIVCRTECGEMHYNVKSDNNSGGGQRTASKQ